MAWSNSFSTIFTFFCFLSLGFFFFFLRSSNFTATTLASVPSCPACPECPKTLCPECPKETCPKCSECAKCTECSACTPCTPCGSGSATGTYSNSRVVLSASSFPGRVEGIAESVHSFFNQTRVPDAVHINIPYKVERKNITLDVFPQVLHELRSVYGSKLRVNLVEDYGPASKLLGTLPVETDPNTIIVILDDDTEYAPDTVEKLVKEMERHPNHSASYMCETYDKNTGAWASLNTPGECRGWACAFAAVALRRAWFDEKVFDYSNVPPTCKVHDDVYISGYLWRKGVYSWIVQGGGWPPSSVVKHTRHGSLSINSVPDIGEKQKECIKFFDGFG